ncbi:MAG: hypothetical protein J7L82_02440 [Staphylothermus sp.]|nr:hypothetical protein [Staphylothermus sp.]
MPRRKTTRNSSGTLALIALFLVTLTTFIQNIIDWLQSMSIGAYQPLWQRILILVVLFLSFLGFLIAYMANSKDKRSPIP